MEESMGRDAEGAGGQDFGRWNGGSQAGGRAGSAVAEYAEGPAAPSDADRRREERTRVRFNAACRREEIARQVGRMHAVVVVGEHAWGGGVFDGLACRPLMELAGRPLIVHALDWLRRQGIRSAAICANGQTGLVRECLGDGHKLGLAVQYYTDVMPRGPAGCIRDAAIDSGADTILAVSGMLVPRISVADLLRQHRQAAAWVTVVSCPGGKNSLEPSGLYLFSPPAIDQIAPTGYQDIKETLLPQLRRHGGRIALWTTREGEILRIADLASYVRANGELLECSLNETCGPEYDQSGAVRVHRSAGVHPTARLFGPVIVGPGCRIAANAIVVGPTTLGAGCELGRGAVVSRSVMWPMSHVAAGALVDNCVLGQCTLVEPEIRVRDMFWTKCPRSAPGAGDQASPPWRLAS